MDTETLLAALAVVGMVALILGPDGYGSVRDAIRQWITSRETLAKDKADRAAEDLPDPERWGRFSGVNIHRVPSLSPSLNAQKLGAAKFTAIPDESGCASGAGVACCEHASVNGDCPVHRPSRIAPCEES